MSDGWAVSDTSSVMTRKLLSLAASIAIATMVASPGASAQTLSKKRARAAAVEAVKQTGSRTAASRSKVVRCLRRGKRRYACTAYYSYARMPGASACVSTVIVTMRKRSRRARTSQRRVRCGRFVALSPDRQGPGGAPQAPGGGSGTPAGGLPGVPSLPALPGGGIAVPGVEPAPVPNGVPIVCGDGTIMFFHGQANPCAGHGGVLIGPPPQLPLPLPLP